MDLAEIPVRELLPHDPPMVLLDRITSFDEATLTAEVDIGIDSMFCGDDGVPGWVGIEYMAQAVAAHAGYKGRLEGNEPLIGYLLGTRAYKCLLPRFPVGETLRVHVESLFVEMALGAFACRIDLGETVATATINVYQPKGDVAEGVDAGKISR
jgi:predicted hotdog family 3-hydroxylacyl-ACP dehydratase